MQTSTFIYLCFLALVFIIYFLFPKKLRWVWLLFASYVFLIKVDFKSGIVLLIVTLFSYVCAIIIGRSGKRNLKKYWLILGISLIVSTLFIFKYLNFSLSILDRLSKVLGLPGNFEGIKIFIPLGISFYTLQAISYLIDIYNDVILPEMNPGKYALYLAFFPKFLSGPIERGGKLLPQILEPKPFEYSRFVDGLTRIGWGFFKKLVIADRLGVIVNTLFQSPDNFASPVTLLAVFSFSLQIYIDFSAYCDIAIGSAKLLGIDLIENFNLPYFAKSVTEFWRRWHISFTSWLRDYIFTPLNFATRRKRSKIYQYRNILIVFLLAGSGMVQTTRSSYGGFYMVFIRSLRQPLKIFEMLL